MVVLPVSRVPGQPSIPWRFVVVLILAKGAWDTVGMLAGDTAFTGPAYDVLRTLPPVGGMRARGLVFAGLLAVTFWAANRLSRRGDGRALRWCLTGLAVWYMGWATGLASAWLLHDRVLGWSAPASVLVVAVLAMVAARNTPHAREQNGGR